MTGFYRFLQYFNLFTIWLHAKPLLHLQDFINAALDINPSQTFRKRTPKMPGKILWLLTVGGRLQESNRRGLYWEEFYVAAKRVSYTLSTLVHMVHAANKEIGPWLQMGCLLEVKNNEKLQNVTRKNCRSRLWEVLVCKRFQTKRI